MIRWEQLNQIADNRDFKSILRTKQVSTKNLYAMYHSPEWLSCHSEHKSNNISIAMHHKFDTEKNKSFAAFERRKIPLSFMFSRRNSFSFSVPALELMGSDLVGDNSKDHLKEIIEEVWIKHPDIDAIYLKSIQTTSPLWKLLRENNWNIGSAHIYIPERIRRFHYIELPDSHHEYLSGFRSKQRFTLKKKTRRLNEAFPGKVEILRFDNEDNLNHLIYSALRIIENSWKSKELVKATPESIKNPAFLRRVAQKGLLRSHILSVDGKPCAFIIGYIYQGIYHYADLAYDMNYAKYSPGTVLLYMVIEELIKKDRAKFINFGITDVQY